MCRWMGWLGQPILVEELLFKTQHGIVDQSLHSRMGAEPTNGDGFGLGWYGAGAGPGVYHSVAPAWGDANLRELAAHIEAPLFLAHVRAAIGSPIQATNCHPFRKGRWLFVHNGFIADFHLLRRDLMLAIDPAQFADVQGSTDTEVVFHLALTLGLESDPISALERTVGVIEATARERGVEAPVQATFGVSDGTRLWAVRYASEGTARSLFASADIDALKHLHPEIERLQTFKEGDRVIVSEPFADLPGAWQEIPQGSAVCVQPGGALEERPVRPTGRGERRARRLRSPGLTGSTVGQHDDSRPALAPDPLQQPRPEVLLAHKPYSWVDPRRRRVVARILRRDQHEQRVGMRRTQPSRHLDAVEARHTQVEQHQVRREPGDRLQRLLAVGSFPYGLEPRGGVDDLASDPSEHRLVIDGEDADVHKVTSRPGLRPSGP